jgi:hypothetical protein
VKRRLPAATVLVVVIGGLLMLLATSSRADNGTSWKELGAASGHIPPIPSVHYDKYGRVTSYWSCFDFGPYPGITQKEHHVTNIVLCGDVSLTLPPPPRVSAPVGSPNWICWDPPDAIRFTVPFTLPRCDWGSTGDSFTIHPTQADFDKGVAKSSAVKLAAIARKDKHVPAFTGAEKAVLLKAYLNDQLKLSADQAAVVKASGEEAVVRDFFETLAQVTPGLNVFTAVRELADGKGMYSERKLETIDQVLALLTVVTFGLSGISGLKGGGVLGKGALGSASSYLQGIANASKVNTGLRMTRAGQAAIRADAEVAKNMAAAAHGAETVSEVSDEVAKGKSIADFADPPGEK